MGWKNTEAGAVTLDEHLIRFAAGDDSEFEAFYRATQKTVYHIALGILGERSLAEDVMQTSYLKILANAGRYRAGSNAAAWIARIARNEALNEKKRRSREQPTDESEVFGAKPDEYGFLTDLARRVLSEGEFTVLMLAAVDGYKRREIASMLSIPVPTVTWRYHRAIEKLRRALKEEE